MGNLPNLIISSQDGQGGKTCYLSSLGTSDAWNQASQSHDSLPILPFQICGSIGRLTMAPALPWGTVSPGEGGGEVLVGSSSVEEQAETAPWLNSPGTRWDPEISWPSPCPQLSPYRTTNKLKLCHISNFLLALLYLLNFLKLLKFSAQTAVYDFLIFIRQCTMVSKYQTMCTIWFIQKILDVQ